MPERAGQPPSAPVALKWLKGFGAFWWDFLVSDTPELTIGVLAVVAVDVVLGRLLSLNAAAVVAFPLLVAVVLVLSLLRARPRPPR